MARTSMGGNISVDDINSRNQHHSSFSNTEEVLVYVRGRDDQKSSANSSS